MPIQPQSILLIIICAILHNSRKFLKNDCLISFRLYLSNHSLLFLGTFDNNVIIKFILITSNTYPIHHTHHIKLSYTILLAHFKYEACSSCK